LAAHIWRAGSRAPVKRWVEEVQFFSHFSNFGFRQGAALQVRLSGDSDLWYLGLFRIVCKFFGRSREFQKTTT
jgi:hypothetical protein